jgi:hypothetical protein
MYRWDNDFEAFERIMQEDISCIHFVVWPQRGGQVTEFFRWLTHTHAMRWRVSHHTVGYSHLYQGRSALCFRHVIYVRLNLLQQNSITGLKLILVEEPRNRSSFAKDVLRCVDISLHDFIAVLDTHSARCGLGRIGAAANVLGEHVKHLSQTEVFVVQIPLRQRQQARSDCHILSTDETRTKLAADRASNRWRYIPNGRVPFRVWYRPRQRSWVREDPSQRSSAPPC